MGVEMLDFMIATPERHILARNRVFWHILRQNQSRGLGCSELQEPPPKKRKNGEKTSRVNTFGSQSHACAKQKPWANRDELLHRCRGPRRNHLCQLLWLSLMGFERGMGGGVKFCVSPLTRVVALTTLSHYRASVCVILRSNWLLVLVIFSRT